MTPTKLIVEREKTHGDFKANAMISQALKEIVRDYGGVVFNDIHKESLDMICLKLSRILSGRAGERDHWDDIAGYALLAANACPNPPKAGKSG